jgi:uncharacterized repeat protein (TIGR03803 family)
MNAMKNITVVIAFLLAGSLSAQTPVFYGMTEYGGSDGLGAIIKFNPATNAESVVWSLGNGSDGSIPIGNLANGAGNGLFYGMTAGGGSNGGKGAIISFNPSTNAEAVVWSFGSGSDGANPEGTLVYDAAKGLFYGMTSGGGTNGKGAIISFNPSTNAEAVVWDFGSGSDGANPGADLVYDAVNGLFYGMTTYGGNNSNGTIISFNPSTNAEAVLWSFGGVGDGAYPYGDLVYDAYNALFYGTTETGGTAGGIIFSFNPGTNAEAVVWNFGSGSDGKEPRGNLVYDATNNLFYATTNAGGTNSQGAIISFNPATNAEAVEWDFGSGTDGNDPIGSLSYDANNGLFYGMTYSGGTNNKGAIISFNPSTNAEAVVWSLGSGSDGLYPWGNLVYYGGTASVNDIASSTSLVNVYPNPNNGVFTLQSSVVSGQLSVEIYNMLGEKVYSAFLPQTPKGALNVDLSNQSNGIYLYRLISGTGELIGEGKITIAH